MSVIPRAVDLSALPSAVGAASGKIPQTDGADGWDLITTPTGAGAVGLLAVVSHVGDTYTTTSTSPVDVDATNLAAAFTVPASGRVLVRLSTYADMSVIGTNADRQIWNLRDSGGDIAGTKTIAVRYYGTASRGLTAAVTMIVGGLTPEASVTFKWGWSVTGGTGRIVASDDTFGSPAIMEVWAA